MRANVHLYSLGWVSAKCNLLYVVLDLAPTCQLWFLVDGGVFPKIMSWMLLFWTCRVDHCRRVHACICVCEIVVFELGFLMTTGHILLNLSCIPPNLLADRMLFFTSETNKLVHYCYHLCPKFQLVRQHEPSNNCGRQVKPNDQSLASPVESRHECAEMIVWILPHSMAQHTTV